MKKVLLLVLLLLIPSTGMAESELYPEPLTVEEIMTLIETIKNDEVVEYNIHSIYPPIMDISLESGRELIADSDILFFIKPDGTKRIVAQDACDTLLVVGFILCMLIITFPWGFIWLCSLWGYHELLYNRLN